MSTGSGSGYVLPSAGNPTAVATAAPNAPDTSPTLITLDASTSTGSGVLTYAWVLYGPNGLATSLLSDPTNVSPTFTTTLYGGWTAILTVTDANGSAVDTAAVQVGISPVPGVGFTVGPNERIVDSRDPVDQPDTFDIPGATVV